MAHGYGIAAPEVMTLFDPNGRYEMLHFIAELRNTSAKAKHITIDLRSVREMHVDATLLLRAEMETIHRERSVVFRLIYPKGSREKQVLCQIGIMDFISNKMEIPITHCQVVKWAQAHGTNVDGTKYDEVLGPYNGQLAPSITSGLYNSITEAMSNCLDHAYIIPRSDPKALGPKNHDWWMFSAEDNGRLMVAFCDLGAGIPETIGKRHPWMKKIIARMRKNDDATHIHVAMSSGKSRTKMRYRGKGLPMMLREIKKIEGGMLHVLSNKGLVSHCGKEPDMINYGSSILGTMLMWSVPLNFGEERNETH